MIKMTIAATALAAAAATPTGCDTHTSSTPAPQDGMVVQSVNSSGSRGELEHSAYCGRTPDGLSLIEVRITEEQVYSFRPSGEPVLGTGDPCPDGPVLATLED